jgi:metal-dependent amidase/aminoacylase/carboxypeptidase family protein
MDRVDSLKKKVIAEVEAHRSELIGLSLKIHDSPETAFQETKAARWLTDYLERAGFAVERGICRLETAFRATSGEGAPRVAVLAEYDALPGVGHGCGHNLIALASVGAGIAAKAALPETGGSVLVIGTPAEEAAAWTRRCSLIPATVTPPSATAWP